MDAFFYLCLGIAGGMMVVDEKSNFWAAIMILNIILTFFRKTQPSDWGL